MVEDRLSTLDELYLHLDRPAEPWSVQVEIRTSGRIDASRLHAAARAAAARHPTARIWLASGHRWEIADELKEVALDEVSGDQLPAARERLLSHTPSLDRPGPFELLLSHDPAGDVVVLNLHHAAGDGVSAVRLMLSLARAYGDQDDAPREGGAGDDPAEPGQVRHALAAGVAEPGVGRPTGPGPGVGRPTGAARAAEPPARIAVSGGRGDGYGFELIRLDRLAVERIVRQAGVGEATVNDALVGAIAVTVRRWNDRHGGDRRASHISMPVELAPAGSGPTLGGNNAPYVSLRIDPGEPASLAMAIAGAAESSRRIQAGEAAGLLAELFASPTLHSQKLRQRMQNLIALTGNLLADTAVLSSLGQIAAPLRFGDAGMVRELWISPPVRMPVGAAFGAVGLGDALFVTLRYRHALFDPPAAREFADVFRQVLALA